MIRPLNKSFIEDNNNHNNNNNSNNNNNNNNDNDNINNSLQNNTVLARALNIVLNGKGRGSRGSAPPP